MFGNKSKRTLGYYYDKLFHFDKYVTGRKKSFCFITWDNYLSLILIRPLVNFNHTKKNKDYISINKGAYFFCMFLC